MAELQNANPVILSAAQLPSRRLRKDVVSRRGPEFKFDCLLASHYPTSYRQRDMYSSTFALSSDYSQALSDNLDYEDIFDSEGSEGLEAAFTEEPIDEQEIYDLISTISDPEHPHTLGQLSVVNLPDIHVSPKSSAYSSSGLRRVVVYVTPTINHCSLVTVIGLAIRVRLEQTLPPNYRVDIQVKEGSHSQDDQVTKQLSDKERVAAALENDTLRSVLDKMLETCT